MTLLRPSIAFARLPKGRPQCVQRLHDLPKAPPLPVTKPAIVTAKTYKQAQAHQRYLRLIGAPREE
jgi:hypothetical protein